MNHITNGLRRHCAPAPATVPLPAFRGLVGEQAMTHPATTALPFTAPKGSAARWSFDCVNHPNPWDSRMTSPTFYRARGTFSPPVTIAHPDESSETARRTDYFRAT